MKAIQTLAGWLGITLIATALAALTPEAHADAVTDWNVKSGEIITEARIGTPPAIRVMALVQTAAHNAAVAVAPPAPQAAPTIDAAIAAAHRAMLLKLLPAQQASIDSAYQAALAPIADNAAKSAGIALGERAAAELLAQRGDDGAASPEAYRPHTTAGAYVPTAGVAIPQWPQRKPWLMMSAAQFRPAAPSALSSGQWAREFNEVKEFGGKVSSRRSAEQTDIARFWDYSLPATDTAAQHEQPHAEGRDPALDAAR